MANEIKFLIIAAVIAGMIIIPGCARSIPNSADAICDQTKPLRTALGTSLANDDSAKDGTIIDGANLLRAMKSACMELTGKTK